jgi:VPDSG-CTERM motif
MNHFKTWSSVAALLCAGAMVANGQYDLRERAFNIDSTIYDVPFGTPPVDPPGANLAGFNTSTGLGTISYSIGAGNAGAHYVAAFFDHDIDAAINTFFNELGSVSGAPVAGQSWEVDEPGYTTGDIYNNLVAGTLSDSVDITTPDDVSMAMGWSFNMGASDVATIDWTLGTTRPSGGGLILIQTDPDSQKSIYFSSTLSFGSVGPFVPDSGSTLMLLGVALTAISGLSARLRRE